MRIEYFFKLDYIKCETWIQDRETASNAALTKGRLVEFLSNNENVNCATILLEPPLAVQLKFTREIPHNVISHPKLFEQWNSKIDEAISFFILILKTNTRPEMIQMDCQIGTSGYFFYRNILEQDVVFVTTDRWRFVEVKLVCELK